MLSGATREGSPPEHCDVRLRDYALNYLARFPASVTKLRIVLLRRARLKEQILTSEGLASLIGELQRSGYVDDERFALARTRSLLRRGASLFEIRSKLARDGIAASQIKETLASFVVKEGSEALELVAAMRVARKRAIGPFRRTNGDYAVRQKDMAALARKGFSYGVLRRLFDASEEELEMWQKNIEEEY